MKSNILNINRYEMREEIKKQTNIKVNAVIGDFESGKLSATSAAMKLYYLDSTAAEIFRCKHNI